MANRLIRAIRLRRERLLLFTSLRVLLGRSRLSRSGRGNFEMIKQFEKIQIGRYDHNFVRIDLMDNPENPADVRPRIKLFIAYGKYNHAIHLNAREAISVASALQKISHLLTEGEK